MRWQRRRKKEPGWAVVQLKSESLAYVRALPAHASARARVLDCGIYPLADAGALGGVSRALSLARCDCATLLAPEQYQLLVVDAPNVSREELKSAIRWRVKDLLDHHVDDVTIDMLDMPVPKDAPNAAHSMYAVAARNDAIQAVIKQCEQADIPLAVIDIEETAQRNIATLFEQDGRGVAMLYFYAEHGGLLTINYRGELYMARRFDVSLAQLEEAADESRARARERVLLEVQRSLDHIDRQFKFIPMARLVVGPTPLDTGITAYLRDNVEVAVSEAQLDTVLDFAAPVDTALQWELFHLIGAALRVEAKAL